MPDDNNTLSFQEMSEQDIPAAIDLIRKADPQDAAAAEESFRSGRSLPFVLADPDGVVGVTGITPIEDTDASAWLSWTAIHPDLASEELITHLLNQLHEQAQIAGYRKLFATETTMPPPHSASYHRMLTAALRGTGYQIETTHNDYYQPGEGVVYYGLRLRDPDNTTPTHQDNQKDDRGDDRGDNRGVQFTDSDEIPECDDTYYLDWQYTEPPGSTHKDIERWIKKVRKWKGRLLLLSAPTDAKRVRELVRDCGFNEAGTLKDFYADGLHEHHYIYPIQ